MKDLSEKEIARRKKISAALKGRKHTCEHIAKVAVANRGQKRSAEAIEKFKKNAKKQFSNPENREKARQNALRQWSDKKKRSEWVAANGRRVRKAETRAKIASSVSLLWRDPKYKEAMSRAHKGNKAWNKGIPMTEEYRANVIKAINKPSVLKKKRLRSKALWQNEEYISKIQAAYHRKPNKPEAILFRLLEKLSPGQWRYTGDFSLVVNGKCPDFVNINGEKKIIELFGDYWHAGEKPEDRANIFKPFGYETLVIWESELKNEQSLTAKIKAFHTYGRLHAVK